MPPKSETDETSSWTRRMLRDPITKILQENSHLTEVQLETLLIDYLMDGFTRARTDYETKAQLRRNAKSHKIAKGVSRGAFNRSLAQARKNIISSIYTLILLGYLGFFETPSLMRYQDLAETIGSFARDYDQLIARDKQPTQMQLQSMKQARKKILQLIDELAKPLAIKPD